MTARFANILFSGRCNLRCPRCIGRLLPAGPTNLHRFPLPGLEPFLTLLRRRGVRELTLTGTNTDPQLYRHEGRLLQLLREHHPELRLNLHTNGVLALRRMELFNRYHRATISLPSFRSETAARITGRAWVVPLARILRRATIPIKVSILLTRDNAAEVPRMVRRCAELGVRRAVLRRPFGELQQLPWPLPVDAVRCATFAGMPVYRVGLLELTLWTFERVQLRCLNLHSDGSISERYLLAPRPPTDGGRGTASADATVAG